MLGFAYETRLAVRSPPEQHSNLTQLVNSMVLESQLPHTIVNLLFTIANQETKVTISLGLDFLKLLN